MTNGGGQRRGSQAGRNSCAISISRSSRSAPRSLAPRKRSQDQHRINIGIASSHPPIEVALKLEGKAEIESMVLFTFD
jgi:hypothetical protein